MAEAPSPSEIVKKESLSTKEMENLIASVGNSESKAATLLVMKPGIIYSGYALQQELIKSQGPNPTWKMDHQGVMHYCERSFEPIGLVAGEVTDELSRRVGFVKTKYGEEVGDPFAALLADYSLRHPNLSLYTLFGATLSSGKGKEVTDDTEYRKRAVSARLKLFWELTTADLPLRVANLGDETGEDRVQLAQHLANLGRYGVLQYNAVKYGQHFTGYKVTEQGVGFMKSDVRTDIPNIGPVLAEIFVGNKERWLTRGDVSEEAMKTAFKKHVDNKTDRKVQIERQMGGIVQRWVNKGYLVVGGFHDDLRSTVNLTTQQRNDLIELLEILDKFQKQSPDIVRTGIELVNQMTPQKVALLMAKAKQASPFANRESVENFADELSLIFSVQPALTAGEITKILNEQGKNISADGIRVRLNKLEQRGLIERSSPEKNATWSLKTQSSSNVPLSS